VFPSPSVEFQEISSASRPPRAVTAAARLGSHYSLVWCWWCAAASCGTGLCPSPSFLSAYKREASRLWGRRGRRFLVALSPPLPPTLPFHWSAQSRTAPPFKEGQAHGGGEEHHHLTLHSRQGLIDRSRRALYRTHACLFFCCCCAGAFLDLLEFGSVIGKRS